MADEKQFVRWFDFPDLEYSIRCAWDVRDDPVRGGQAAYWVDWAIYEHFAWDPKTGHVLWISRRDESSPIRNDTTENREEAVPLFDGFIKWDGCCQFKYHGYNFHFDSPEQIKNFGAILHRVYGCALEIMPHQEENLRSMP